MPIELMIQELIAASPKRRLEVARVLRGETATDKTGKPDTRLVTITGAASLLSISRTACLALVDSGRLDTVHLNGRNRRVTMASINAFLAGERPPNEKTAALVAERRAKRDADPERVARENEKARNRRAARKGARNDN